MYERRQLLLGYEPGYWPMPWLEGGAKLIQAGSDLVLEMHYNPNGKEATDHSEVGLYFAKSATAERVLAVDFLRDLDFAIPPRERDYRSKGRADARPSSPALLSVSATYVHVPGQRSMEVRAIYADGHREMLLSVPKYDFNWQTTYVLRKPLELPAGTRLESIAGFDQFIKQPVQPRPERNRALG